MATGHKALLCRNMECIHPEPITVGDAESSSSDSDQAELDRCVAFQREVATQATKTHQEEWVENERKLGK